MNHFVSHLYSEKWAKWTKRIILSPTSILKKDKINKINKMNHFVPPLFWKKSKWTKWTKFTKWIILSPTSNLKKDKINKMNHFVPPLFWKKSKWRQNEKVSFSAPVVKGSIKFYIYYYFYWQLILKSFCEISYYTFELNVSPSRKKIKK